jgi:putative NADPH-quinone reductase
VLAHPLEDSLCAYLAKKTIEHLEKKGYQITLKDLYKEKFQPALTKEERESYYAQAFDSSGVHSDIAQLEEAQSLVLIFPTWWFSFPAILKGWFDRVWAPGHAYNHASDLGFIQPCLLNLKEVKVITILGAAWWVDFFILRQPIKKVLKYALVGACTKKCHFQMLSMYKSEKLSEEKLARFVHKIRDTF